MQIGDKITVTGIVTNIIPGYDKDKVEIDHSLVTEIDNITPVQSLIQTSISNPDQNVQTPNQNEASPTEDNVQQ